VKKELRWYQQKAVDSVFEYWERAPEGGSPLVVLPTGAGKSLVIGALVQRLVEHGARVAIITHRSELVRQDLAAIREWWPQAPVATYAASLNRRNVSQVTVCQLQSICRKPQMLGAIDVVLIDEAHLVPVDEETSYGKVIKTLREKNADLRLVGLTATPYRLDQGLLTQGKGALFSSICLDVPIRQLVEEGWLAPLRSGAVTAIADLRNVGKRAGDFAIADMELAFDVMEITDAVVRDIMSQVKEGRKSILVYATSIKHAAALRNALRFAGLHSELISGESSEEERQRVFKRFKEWPRVDDQGELPMAIVSCDVLTTGFDAPVVDVVVLVRATVSVSLYVQMLGRGTRCHPSKKDCVVLDYGGNVARHGPITDVKVKPKSAGEGKAPVKYCECGAELSIGISVCPHCGFVFPPPQKKVNAEASELPPMLLRLPTLENGGQAYREVSKGVFGVAVSHTIFTVHTKHLDDGGSRDSLCAIYSLKGKEICREYLSFDASGYAQQMALAWWHQSTTTSLPPPKSTAEAFERQGELKEVKGLAVSQDGKYLRIKGRVHHEHAPAPPPTTDSGAEAEECDWWDA